MARVTGCGLSTGLFGVEKSAVLLSPASKKVTTVRFPARCGGLLVACKASSTTRKPRGIMLPQPISPALQELLGVPEISRAQAIKLIWEYIKANNLQVLLPLALHILHCADPENKKIVVCDEKLKKVFGKDRVGMLEVSGLISPHLLKSQD